MPVGLVRKWTLVALLGAAVAVTACKDDDDPDPKPVDSGSPGGGTTGGSDSGSPGGSDAGSPGGGDSGSPGGGDAAMPVTCGGATCTDHVAGGVITFKAGCATNALDAAVCGISTANLADSGIPPFLEKHAPGADSPSCGAAIDSREPPSAVDAGVNEAGVPLLGPGNGRIDTAVSVAGMMLSITYPGCCTPQGWCSGNTDKGLLLGASPSEGGFGCMTHTVFFRQIDGGVRLPCDPDSGTLMLPATDGGSDSGGGDSGGGDAGTDAGDGG